MGRDSHAVIEEAKADGLCVFAGGMDEAVSPTLVSSRWRSHRGRLPVGAPLDGGSTVLELPSRELAIAWAARIAKACRCDQALRAFQFAPQS